MFGWGDAERSYDQVYNNDNFDDHKSSLSHEIIAGGAALAGMREFEHRQRKEGKSVSHKLAKELLAGLAGAEVDKLAQTRGEDWFDRKKAKHYARENAERMYDDHYLQGQRAGQYYDPYQHGPPQRFVDRGWC